MEGMFKCLARALIELFVKVRNEVVARFTRFTPRHRCSDQQTYRGPGIFTILFFCKIMRPS